MAVAYWLVVRWFVAYALLCAASLPIAAALFRGFHDRGAALALPVGFGVVTLVVYWVGHVALSPATMALGVIVLLALAAVAWRRGARPDRRGYAEAMAVFAAAFLFLVAIRAVDPAVHPAGGEKFLNYGLLQTTLRADRLPPEDVWFAGRRVRYYYGGHLLTAVLTRLTATPPRFSYNLALAGFYATLVTAAYGTAGAMADRAGRSPRIAGALAAFLVGFAGNLATPGRVLLGLVPRPLAAEYGHALIDGIRMPYGEALRAATSASDYSYWFARYVIPQTLNPFPLWAFLNGDLNAYMMNAPFLLLAVALCYAYYRAPETARSHRRLLAFGALPATLGLLALVSTWGFVTACGLVGLALLFAEADPLTLFPALTVLPGDHAEAGRPDGATPATALGGVLSLELRRIVAAAAPTAVIAGLGSAWAAPYLLFHAPVSRGVGFLPPRSGLGGLLLVHGLFLAAFALYLFPRVRSLADDWPRWRVGAGLAAGLAVLGWLAVAADLAAVALLGPFLVVAWALARRGDAGFELVLLVAAAGLVIAVEFAYARVFPYTPTMRRWVTVYKAYMHVWVILGTAGGVAFGAVFERAAAAVGSSAADRPTVRPGGRSHQAAAVVAAVLLLSASTFGALALSAHFDPSENPTVERPTLEATRFVEERHPAEAAAIAWLDAREGQPNVVSRPGRVMYTWTNAPASLTGVPTLAGWAHAKGYHGIAAYEERARAVEVVFNGSRPAATAALEEYDVRYVYVGPNEREKYGTRDFDALPGVSVAFRNEAVTVYEVNQSRPRERRGPLADRRRGR